MTSAWLILIALGPMIAGLCRDLIALACDARRRTAIQRIIQVSGGRTLIVDRSAGGAVLQVEIEDGRSGRTRSRGE